MEKPLLLLSVEQREEALRLSEKVEKQRMRGGGAGTGDQVPASKSAFASLGLCVLPLKIRAGRPLELADHSVTW